MWKLWTELELWWLDLQLGGLGPLTLWMILLLALGVPFLYAGLRIVIWRNRVDFARELLGSPSFIFPPPTVRLKVVVVSALVVAAAWYLWK